MKKNVAIIILAISSVVAIVSMAAIILMLVGGFNFSKKKTNKDTGEEIRVVDVRSIASLAVFGKINYDPTNLLDNKLATCWSVNLPKAGKEAHYYNNILEGVVFTLADPNLGSMVMWNGYAKTSELFIQNAAAIGVTLIDLSDKSVVAEFKIPDQYGPFVGVIDKKLGACSDGSYRVQVNFGSVRMPGVRVGNRYDDFCISEIHFWTGTKPIVRYPIGNRAIYDLRGPVRSFVDYDGKTHTFSREGFERSGEFTYSSTATVINYDNHGGIREFITETYALDGYLTSYKSERYFARDWQVNKKNYTYNSEGYVTSISYSGVDGTGEYIYGYENGQMVSMTHNVKTSTGYVPSGSPEKYEVLEVDDYGNWLSRKETGSGRVDTRTIDYYL